jgi:hypothetical protein
LLDRTLSFPQSPISLSQSRELYNGSNVALRT